MRIAIDNREATSERKTGKGQWAYGFVQELQRRIGCTAILYGYRTASQQLSTESFSRSPLWHLRVAWDVWRKWKRGDIDMYMSPTSFIVPALIGKWVPCVPIVHDLIAFRRDEQHDRKARWIERWTLGRALRFAKFICTNSESTKQDLLKRYPFLHPDAIAVIFAGPSFETPSPCHGEGFCEAKLSRTTTGWAPQDDMFTILCIGTLCPRKNQLRLIEAYRRLSPLLRKQYRLLLVGGRGWGDTEVVRRAKETDGVEWRGYVSPSQCEELLKTCTVFAYPSLYEGFGIPLLDALQRGIPVLTSNRGGLREIASDAAVIIDPENIDSIAQGLHDLLTNDHLRETLGQQGKRQAALFSWKRTVDLFCEAVSRVFSFGGGGNLVRFPTSPKPPSPS
ncbi:hypothetical protein A2635_03365 [Candidatus Peribacteria bacterium RIFCSPHIGHO2_01_FULL_51_9]|nr:MAG: hypothetical protein A2635_03365 [Candidatus Peribacteria bacterium RIFCSPHIGHO2_01_FULL_51_9]